jgi:hypothetical protein
MSKIRPACFGWLEYLNPDLSDRSVGTNVYLREEPDEEDDEEDDDEDDDNGEEDDDGYSG